MVEYDSEQLDDVFRALADPTRRRMLQRLVAGEQSIGELAAPFDMSFAGASKHVKVLEGAGLIVRTIQGRTHRCRLAAKPLAEAHDWLAFYQQFWVERLQDLERELRRGDRGATNREETDE